MVCNRGVVRGVEDIELEVHRRPFTHSMSGPPYMSSSFHLSPFHPIFKMNMADINIMYTVEEVLSLVIQNQKATPTPVIITTSVEHTIIVLKL